MAATLLSPSEYIVAAGFLQKPRGGVEAIVQGGWVERYFVLTKGALLYYHLVEGTVDRSGKPSGTIFGADGQLLLFDEKKMVSIKSIVDIKQSAAEELGTSGKGRASKHHHHFTLSFENAMNGAREDLLFRTTSQHASRVWIRTLRRLTQQDVSVSTRWEEEEVALGGAVDVAELVPRRRSTRKGSSSARSGSSEVEQMRKRLMALEQHIFSTSQGAAGAPAPLAAIASQEDDDEDLEEDTLDDDGDAPGKVEDKMAISGWLEKRARASALWQKRWVEVDGPLFRYYHYGRQTPALSIELHAGYSVHELDGNEFGFALTDGKQNLVFQVLGRRAGAQTRERWMHTLRRVIRSTVVGGEDAGSDADGEGETFSTLALDSAHDAFIRGGKKFLSSALKVRLILFYLP